MNRRMAMGGDTSLNVPMREDGDGQWQDWLVDNEPLQDQRVAEAQEADMRHAMLTEALDSAERPRKAYIERTPPDRRAENAGRAEPGLQCQPRTCAPD